MLDSLRWILWGFVALVFLLCAHGFVKTHRDRRLRPDNMRAVASSLGLQFQEQGDVDGRILAALEKLKVRLFDPRHGDWRVRNVIHGVIQGYEVLVFDHGYLTWSTVGLGNRSWRSKTYICISSEKLSLPAFERELEDRFRLNGRGTHVLYHGGGWVKPEKMAERIRNAVALVQRGKRKLVRG